MTFRDRIHRPLAFPVRFPCSIDRAAAQGAAVLHVMLLRGASVPWLADQHCVNDALANGPDLDPEKIASHGCLRDRHVAIRAIERVDDHDVEESLPAPTRGSVWPSG